MPRSAERTGQRELRLDVSGMTSLYLDLDGHLHWFMHVPPQREPSATNQTQPDWSTAFHEAGLDIANFRTVPSSWVPLHAYDLRAAWDGADPLRPENNIHVEAASFHGAPVYYQDANGNQFIYVWGMSDTLKQFQFANGKFVSTTPFATSNVTVAPTPGTISPTAPRPAYLAGSNGGTTRTAIGAAWAVELTLRSVGRKSPETTMSLVHFKEPDFR